MKLCGAVCPRRDDDGGACIGEGEAPEELEEWVKDTANGCPVEVIRVEVAG